jgi:prepilin peptidase CpaA
MSLTLFDTFSLTALAVMLGTAIWHDAWARRIPNALVLWGAATALGLSLSPHGIGLGSALGGGMVGFLGFWVLYLMRMVGAGDVKLAAATGFFVGHPDMLWVNLLILAAGGALSIVWALSTGQLGAVLRNLQSGLLMWWLNRPHDAVGFTTAFPVSRTRMPYAVAIGMGTALHVFNTWPAA